MPYSAAPQAPDAGMLTDGIKACMRHECCIALKEHEVQTGQRLQPPNSWTDGYMPFSEVGVDQCAAHNLEPALVRECAYMARMVIHALANPITVSYDATRCASRQEELEWQERTRYNDLIMAYNMPHYRPDDVGGTLPYPCPAIVRDKHNKVLLWSLPGILLPGRQRKMLAATAGIANQFEENAPRPTGPWRLHDKFFVRAKGDSAPRGAPIFSPASFPTGCSPQSGHEPVITPTLLDGNHHSGKRFLLDMLESQAIMASIMHIIHPQQHYLGRKVIETLVGTERYHEAVSLWPTSFTALEVARNRWSPLHRESRSALGSFNLTAILSDFVGGHMNFRTLPMDFLQDPGSVIAFCSRLLPHEVEAFMGTRTSFMWSSKDDVASWADGAPILFCDEETIYTHVRCMI